MRLVALFVSALVLSACAQPAAHEEPPPAAQQATPTRSRFSPLAGEWIRDLPGPDGKPAFVMTPPLASTEPKPLVVGVHGAASRPDWMCGAVRDSFGPDTFVVCPHPLADIHQVASWGSGAQLREAVDRAVAAALAEYGERIDTSRLVYFGHSQGAMALPGAYTAALPPARPFSGVVFFEGLPRRTDGLGGTLHAMGARDVLLVNGQGGWQAGHAALATRLGAQGFHAWHVAGKFGHFFNAEAHSILLRETPLLFEPAG